MMMVAAIAAGGAIGSVLRHCVGQGAMALLGTNFPYGTLFVNIVGSFMMGVLIGLFATQLNPSREMQAFLTVGVLGGFTTFSSFSLDVVTLWERGDVSAAVLYAALSVIVSLAALVAGLFLIRSFTA